MDANSQELWDKQPSRTEQQTWLPKLFRFALATLPYGFYINLLVILIVAFIARRQLKQTYGSCIDPLTRGSLIAVTIGMIISAIAAIDKGEAALQLANFLPFFWLFTILPFIVRSPLTQYKLARDWVLASLPINAVAIVEYLAKNNRLPSFCYDWGFMQAWQEAPHIGRAMVMFDHPNVLANYAVLTFGLSLGLIFSQAVSQDSGQSISHGVAQEISRNIRKTPRWIWLIIAALNLVGLFCSGSRNGILVAFSQLLLLVLITKLNRTLILLGSLSIAAFGISIFTLGLGTRSLGILQIMDDPRLGVWKIALDLIRERPLLGWGPGSFKLLYPSRLIDPTYQIVFHPHNLWLLLSAEYGIPVMIGLTVTVGFICYRARRAIQISSGRLSTPQPSTLMLTGYGLALWGTIQFSMIDVTFYDARLNVMAWGLLAVLYAQGWLTDALVNTTSS
ncbi:MAG: O-antigen ligase family protein [Cyanobacteria bacterium P01_F01_bin.150]